ncbi:hypothetical protein FNH22_23030 [Fulvivirga sp. M361]|uniref:YybH family protein n=1 Tax=Fulvivirga sp. M361 TaxID=2594266 RepID=UPI00117BB792|nr:hypothetical protein [Fulvivirga sp. M361]TRX52050.1 hypothetical protein FNH22_23030 [Fulvivirga sp. M361]
MSKNTFFVSIFLMLHLLGKAQSPDILYQKFSKGYDILDAALISNLYARDAELINLYKNAAPKSFKGRKAILNFFESLFNLADEESKSLKIVFKITDRQENGVSILDNGFYHLCVSSAHHETYDRYGKFSIVLQKESGEWKFFTDANSSATREEFEKATSINP